MCKVEEDCTEAARCDGTAAMCPNPAPKPDNVTECNEGTQVSCHGSDPLLWSPTQCYEAFLQISQYNTDLVRPIDTICVDSIEHKRKTQLYNIYLYVFVLFQVCQKGECTDSICLKYDLSSCFLTSDKTSDKRRLCDLACQYNNTCVSTKELAEKYPNLGAKSLSLRPGSPCDEYQVWQCFLSPFYIERFDSMTFQPPKPPKPTGFKTSFKASFKTSFYYVPFYRGWYLLDEALLVFFSKIQYTTSVLAFRLLNWTL